MKRRSYRDDEYLEAIFILEKEAGKARVKDIASILGVRAPSVVEYLEKLASRGLIIYHKGHGEVELTEEGRRRALEVYERHETIRRLLVLMGVPEEIAEEDACSIEHVISDETFNAFRRLLGVLEKDPRLRDSLKRGRTSPSR